MVNDLWALLVHDRDEPVQTLERILTEMGIETWHVRSCGEARAAFQGESIPNLVLTDTSLPDGSWLDVLKAAASAPVRPPVLVVSRLVDMRLYLDVLESGAHDFVVPTLTRAEVAHIIGGAIPNRRRAAAGTG